MSNTNDIRTQWVAAVLENRMATADYLTPELPPVNLDDMIRPPADLRGRERWATAGEIVAR